MAQDELLSHLWSLLPSDSCDACEGLFTVGECFAALQRMAFGSDGLPMEFYLRFWEVLGRDLVEVLKSSYHSGSLSLSQRRGVIRLSFS